MREIRYLESDLSAAAHDHPHRGGWWISIFSFRRNFVGVIVIKSTLPPPLQKRERNVTVKDMDDKYSIFFSSTLVISVVSEKKGAHIYMDYLRYSRRNMQTDNFYNPPWYPDHPPAHWHRVCPSHWRLNNFISSLRGILIERLCKLLRALHVGQTFASQVKYPQASTRTIVLCTHFFRLVTLSLWSSLCGWQCWKCNCPLTRPYVGKIENFAR